MDFLVSIIIPCFNQEKFIEQALQSVLNQTYDNWECVIVDDGSTDNSAAICKDIAAKNPKIKYIYKKNEGVSKARNVGLDNAKGQFVQFLDADDLLEIKKIERSLQEIKKDADLQMVVTNFKMISSDGKEVFPPFCEIKEDSLTFENFLYNFFSIQLQCGLFKKNLFESLRFPESLSAQEDWIVWISLLKEKPKYSFVDLPLAFYRMNPLGRMNTLGAGDNQIKVLLCLKQILSYEQYYKYTVNYFTKTYHSQQILTANIAKLKKSEEYKLGTLLKNITKKIGLLNLLKRFFKKNKV
ncbi:glycosyltransferase family 2 protein [uncultured Flavobacterium sp.]|uniref:glycosyltransferase family 2 protein n=1 Tax=uncultured Flavobacterium sp. TaxID=165435 RepID=UPI0030C7EA64